MDAEILIPSLGIMTGIIVPIAVFVWLYLESKDKNKTIRTGFLCNRQLQLSANQGSKRSL